MKQEESIKWEHLGKSFRTVMVFHADENGRIQQMVFSEMASVVFTRLAWHQSAPFHLGLLAVTALVFLAAVIVWPIGLLRRFRSEADRKIITLAGSIGLLNLFFLAGLVRAGPSTKNDPRRAVV